MDSAEQLEAVHARHVYVGNDDVHAGLGQQGQGFLTAGGAVEVNVQLAFAQHGQ